MTVDQRKVLETVAPVAGMRGVFLELGRHQATDRSVSVAMELLEPGETTLQSEGATVAADLLDRPQIWVSGKARNLHLTRAHQGHSLLAMVVVET